MLPKKSGFTLIELLVVIAIIAILSVISISVFANAQIAAQDTRRRSEISAIAKSLEASLNPDSNKYTNNLSKDFPSGAPTDPKKTTEYCIKITDGSAISDPDPAQWLSGCVTGGDNWSAVSTTSVFTDVKAWKVCAKLAKTPAVVFCKASLQ